MSEIKNYKLDGVLWREYDFGGRVVRIDSPVELWVGKTTHRILDNDGIVWCVPAPGEYGCVLRWKKAEGVAPVKF